MHGPAVSNYMWLPPICEPNLHCPSPPLDFLGTSLISRLLTVAMTSNLGNAFIDIVYVTEGFDDDECFAIGQTYRLVYRLPSSPGQEEGISLTKNDTHYVWVRIRSRQLVDDVLKKGKWCFCKPERRGKRWKKFDQRLGRYREWQEGEAFFWVNDQFDGQDQV
ncbi:hypothetical protein FOQG_18916 [Fusarium oxysporum f. sp. raphani 54005]|uniref:Uncharacterized protein n=1 Tax=Fusarium oxysporum f. sp. raphani 54005 TaxID=1089458 RepID=X0BCX8_FUSOX|nr:hypothetical protein FOQG_18916 [Fusarium oxysporum f. sp. raphani 54005]